MGTHPIFESDFDCLTEMNNEPEVVMSSSPISKCQQSKTQSSTSSSTKKLTLVVDKTRFICNALIFNQHPNTLLGKMFSPHLLNRQACVSVQPNDNGEYVLSESVSANVFKALLDYYTTGSIRCPLGVSVSELRESCDYFMIPFNSEIVKCDNLAELMHELSNQGARDEFNSLLEHLIVPTLVKATHRGEREIRLVILHDDDVIDWDDEYPPLCEEERHSLYTLVSSNLARFAKYIENREVAKQVLKDRGFKKIRLGIEGYPTTKERVKPGSKGKPEVVYNYVQRPFISMSWEKEENRSRHVDFQCVKSKSFNQLPVEPLMIGNHELEVEILPPEQRNRLDGINDA